MLIDSNGVINIVQQGQTFISALVLLSFEVKSQTGNNNSIVVVRDSIKSVDNLKRYAKSIGKSLGVYMCGTITNIGLLNATQLISTDDITRYQLLVNCFKVTFPTINFFSSLLYIDQDNNNNQNDNSSGSSSNQISIINLIKNYPKTTITCLSYYIGITMLKNSVSDIILRQFIEYLNNSDSSFQNSPLKYQILTIIHFTFTNPIPSAIFGSIISTPFKNIANQYCKQLLLSTNRDQFNIIKYNPINMIKETIKEKGIISTFYSGYPFAFLTDLKNIIDTQN